MNVSSSEAEAEAASFKNMSSPIPYLFGGLGVIFGAIALSLLIIVCSLWKQSLSSESSNYEEKSSNMHVMDMDQACSEPKIVVMMPGENNPTYFAKPVSSITHLDQDIQI
ncbi:unnamed protein product [Lathyrus oleraceus]|uniref:protein GLUTAMINE DUMPER 5-like n=1 Tax=Pisum sativum TaxID=3888 RepID=UPI001FC428E7|nr:protein GLUTAMINE DUMPER 5-like [Pisum sativum]